jgi:ABC-type multidrug transport system ATPase subunit
VLFVIGANGMGKTTTIGKIASRLRNEANQTVLVAACDTFRSALARSRVAGGPHAHTAAPPGGAHGTSPAPALPS